MKFGIKNLGPINDANIEIGDLTIICGKNNVGKTYFTYSLFSFLDTITSNVTVNISQSMLESFYSKGVLNIDLESLLPDYKEALEDATKRFSKVLYLFLAKKESDTCNSLFSCSITDDEYNKNIQNLSLKDIHFPIVEKCDIIANKKENSSLLSLLLSNIAESLPEKDVICNSVTLCVSVLFNTIFSDAFIITCERTGASLFRNELIISREMSKDQQTKQYIERVDNLRKKQEFLGYPLPIKKDIEFSIHCCNESLEESFLCKEEIGKSIFSCFKRMIGGNIGVKAGSIVVFTPDSSNTSLHLIESSSVIRSLSELFFYLKYKAKKEQILMIDEPELSLHPQNQRMIARLFAMLIHAGIKVFITTHSDYIIREFNTLIMLNRDTERIKRLRETFNYEPVELLSPDQIRCYVAEGNTVKPMNVSPKFGIEVTSFDDTISQVNRIQQTLLYGDE